MPNLFLGWFYTWLTWFGIDIFHNDMRQGYGFTFTKEEFTNLINVKYLNDVLIYFKPVNLASSLLHTSSESDFNEGFHCFLSENLRGFLLTIDKNDYMFDRFTTEMWMFETIEKYANEYVSRNYELNSDVIQNCGIRFRNESDAIMYKMIVKNA